MESDDSPKSNTPSHYAMNALDLDHVPSLRKRHRKETQRLLESRELSLSHTSLEKTRIRDTRKRVRERGKEEEERRGEGRERGGKREREEGGRERKRRRKESTDDDDIESIDISVDGSDQGQGIRRDAGEDGASLRIHSLLEAISRHESGSDGDQESLYCPSLFASPSSSSSLPRLLSIPLSNSLQERESSDSPAISLSFSSSPPHPMSLSSSSSKTAEGVHDIYGRESALKSRKKKGKSVRVIPMGNIGDTMDTQESHEMFATILTSLCNGNPRDLSAGEKEVKNPLQREVQKDKEGLEESTQRILTFLMKRGFVYFKDVLSELNIDYRRAYDILNVLLATPIVNKREGRRSNNMPYYFCDGLKMEHTPKLDTLRVDLQREKEEVAALEKKIAEMKSSISRMHTEQRVVCE